MSASIATPLAGLPNHQMSSQDINDYTATDFSDHMELDHDRDHESATDRSHNHTTNADVQPIAPSANDAKTDSEDRDGAIGNLLAALSSRSDNQNQDTTVQGVAQYATPDQTESQTKLDQVDLELQAVVENSGLPTLDAPATGDPLSSGAAFPFPDQGLDLLQPDQENLTPYFPPTDGIDQTPNDTDMPAEPVTPIPVRREFEAFAQLIFPDGSYYLNTYACELGRDILAMRAATAKLLEQEKEAEQRAIHGTRPHSADLKSRNPSVRLRGQSQSHVQGSIVSEAGGFAGIDENEDDRRGEALPGQVGLHSSQASNSSGVVRPQDVLNNPNLVSFDYKRETSRLAQWEAAERATRDEELPEDNERPAAVTSAHLPDPNQCPLIPIHATTISADKTEVQMHKGISRRHVKIYWNFDTDQWEVKSLGRNGMFLDGQHKYVGEVARLYHGAVIQVHGVEVVFKLPKIKQNDQDEIVEESPTQLQTQHESALRAQPEADEAIPSIERRASEVSMAENSRASISDPTSASKTTIKIKSQPAPLQTIVTPDGQVIQKKRGPGRPPKDGFMSLREKKERDKALKLAEAKAANGGKTPPPLSRGKINLKSTPTLMEEPDKDDSKSEKRKSSKKRKRLDENGQPLPFVEGEDSDMDSAEEREAKKARTQREKSVSPAYPPKESLTAEQLQRPAESYAVLLYKLLEEHAPNALPLKRIYREMKLKWPYFVHAVETDGWQSSVRHNLNSEVGKLFTKGDKEGKGYAWKSIPGQTPALQDKKKAMAQPPQPKPRVMPGQPMPGQPNSFHNPGFRPPNGQQFPGQWQGQGAPPNGNWPQGAPPQAGGSSQLPPNQGALYPPGSLPQIPLPPHNTASQNGVQHPRLSATANVANSGQTTSASPSQIANLASMQSTQNTSNFKSISTPNTIPCMLWGIEAMHRFEDEMFKMIGTGNEEKTAKWQEIWASAKRRSLYGHKDSQNSEGDTKEEQVIIRHVNKFFSAFPNPNYRLSVHQKQLNELSGTPVPDAPAPSPNPDFPYLMPAEDQVRDIDSMPPSRVLERIRQEEQAAKEAAKAPTQQIIQKSATDEGKPSLEIAPKAET